MDQINAHVVPTPASGSTPARPEVCAVSYLCVSQVKQFNCQELYSYIILWKDNHHLESHNLPTFPPSEPGTTMWQLSCNDFLVPGVIKLKISCLPNRHLCHYCKSPSPCSKFYISQCCSLISLSKTYKYLLKYEKPSFCAIVH